MYGVVLVGVGAVFVSCAWLMTCLSRNCVRCGLLFVMMVFSVFSYLCVF